MKKALGSKDAEGFSYTAEQVAPPDNGQARKRIRQQQLTPDLGLFVAALMQRRSRRRPSRK